MSFGFVSDDIDDVQSAIVVIFVQDCARFVQYGVSNSTLSHGMQIFVGIVLEYVIRDGSNR